MSFLTGTEAYFGLQKIVMAPHLLADIPRLSGAGQTYGLEAFHSLLINVTPKSRHFSYAGMTARYTTASSRTMKCLYNTLVLYKVAYTTY